MQDVGLVVQGEGWSKALVLKQKKKILKMNRILSQGCLTHKNKVFFITTVNKDQVEMVSI